MQPGEVAAVVEGEALPGIAVEQLARLRGAQRPARKGIADELGHRLDPRARMQRPVDDRQRRRGAARAAGGLGEDLRAVEIAVAPVEAEQELPALAVGEAREVFPAPRRSGVEGIAARRRDLRHVVGDDVAHQADEDKVHRVAERLGDGDHLAVVELVEVGEAMAAAAGEEALVRAGGIAPPHRRFQQRRQVEAGLGGKRGGDPARQRIGRGGGGPQVLRRQAAQAVVEIGHDLQIGDQGAQLGGRAEIELGALVDVEGAVEVVGLEAQVVAVAAAFVEHQAVDHLLRRAAVEQPRRREAPGPQCVRIRQAPQDFGHALLDLLVQGGLDRQVQAVEIVRGLQPQLPEQAGAQGGRRLPRQRRGRRRRGRGAVGETRRLRQGRVAQRRVDDAGLGQQAQVAVDQPVQRRAVRKQEVGRPPLGDQEAEQLAIGQGAALQILAAGRRRREAAVHVVEVGGEPRPEAVADTNDLAEARARRERRGVQVVDDDPLPRRPGVLALEIAAHAGRHHLAQLLGDVGGAAVGRMAELLHLRGQRAAAGAVAFAQDLPAQEVGRDRRQAVPLDGRIDPRRGRVQQFPVLDEEQALDDERRHRVEAGVGALRVPRLEDREAVAAEDGEPGLRLGEIGRDAGLPEVAHEGLGDPGLGLDPVTVVTQRGREARQIDIAQPAVVGAVLGEQDRFAGTAFDPEGHLPRRAGEEFRLQRRGLRLQDREACGRHQEQQRRTATGDEAPARTERLAPSRPAGGYPQCRPTRHHRRMLFHRPASLARGSLRPEGNHRFRSCRQSNYAKWLINSSAPSCALARIFSTILIG